MCALNVMHTHFIPVHCLCSNFVLAAYSYSLLFFPLLMPNLHLNCCLSIFYSGKMACIWFVHTEKN